MLNGEVDKGRWPPLHAWTESCAGLRALSHMGWELLYGGRNLLLFDYI